MSIRSIEFQDTNQLYNDAFDLKSSIRINWDSFSKFIKKKAQNNYTEEQNKKINEYLKDCKNLIGEHINGIKEISKLKEENDLKNESLSKFNEKLTKQYQKETKIYSELQKELTEKKTLFKDSKNEICIIEPRKENLELNEELLNLKQSIDDLEKKDKINTKKLIDLRNELNKTQKVLSVKQYNYYNNINK